MLPVLSAAVARGGRERSEARAHHRHAGPPDCAVDLPSAPSRRSLVVLRCDLGREARVFQPLHHLHDDVRAASAPLPIWSYHQTTCDKCQVGQGGAP